MTDFFTADLHFSHVRINELAGRPFTSVDEMNSELIRRWNARVSVEDTVWVLGDFVMGQKAETLPLAMDLNGRIRLVPGNHDRVHPMDKQVEKWTPQYEAVGIEILPVEVELLPGITMCHFPHEGDSHADDRYTHLRPEDHGQLLLHGHVHEQWQVRDRQVNVGVDVWDFRPVTLDEIFEAAGI